MSSLVVQVKAKLALYAHEKVRSVLEGEYGSVFKGRSMDFDDLREYIPGDDIKDIDWKATARSGQTLIRRYIAVRKHNILFVVDTGKNMNATTIDGSSKCNTAVTTVGILGYLAHKHGDLVGLVAGGGEHSAVQHLPFKGNTPHLEIVLQKIQKDILNNQTRGDVVTLLDFITRTMRRKMFLVVVTDDIEVQQRHEQVLRRIRAQHELLWLNVADATGFDTTQEYYDIFDETFLHDIVRFNPELQSEFSQEDSRRQTELEQMLARLGIVHERIEGEAAIVETLFRALERQKHRG